jgi:hypothetical protein
MRLTAFNVCFQIQLAPLQLGHSGGATKRQQLLKLRANQGLAIPDGREGRIIPLKFHTIPIPNSRACCQIPGNPRNCPVKCRQSHGKTGKNWQNVAKFPVTTQISKEVPKLSRLIRPSVPDGGGVPLSEGDIPDHLLDRSAEEEQEAGAYTRSHFSST